MRIVFFAFLVMPLFVVGQDDSTKTPKPVKDTIWFFEGKSSVNFTQGYLENWAAGGENFLSVLLLNDYSISYEKNKLSWENTFNYKLGGTQQGDQDLRKTEDILEFNSKLGYQLTPKKLFYTNIINFKTQFFKGYDYENYGDTGFAVSQFMNPGNLVIASGFEYKPNKILSAMISPLSGKVTFMTDTANYNQQAYGVDSTKTIKSELGAYLRVIFKKDIGENVNLASKLELFKDYTVNIGVMDVDWQTTLSFDINKYLKTVLFVHLIYDEDIETEQSDGSFKPMLQVKETLGIGFAYKINQK